MTRMKRPLMIWGIIEIGNCLSLAVLVNRSVPRAIIMREFLAVAALALSASMAVAQKTAPGDRVTVLHSEAQGKLSIAELAYGGKPGWCAHLHGCLG